eukprot:2181299-Pleurochrysis_carterae.AAC.1
MVKSQTTPRAQGWSSCWPTASGAGRIRGSSGESRMATKSRRVADNQASSLATAAGARRSKADDGQRSGWSGWRGARGM